MPTVTIDGIIYDGHCLLSDGHLFLYLNKMTLAQGFMILSISEKLSVIHENSYGHERDYEGYTKLVAINDEYGNCNATLIKPITEEE